MEGKIIKIQDGTLDIALRVLLIMYKYNRLVSRERLVAYCYMPSERKHTYSYIGLENTIGSSIHFLLSKQLISFSIEKEINYYYLTHIGVALVQELNKEYYASVIKCEFEMADSYLKSMDDSELSHYLKTRI